MDDQHTEANVLVVEDENVLRLTFAEFLKDAGHAVSVASDFDEAMALIQAQSIDIVVTDILLGAKTGIDLLREVHDQELGCTVIMITGEPNLSTATEAVRLGAFDYLSKPVTRDALLRVVAHALDQKRLREERDLYYARTEILRDQMETIFNSVNEGVITVDADLKVRQVNRAARAIFGLQGTLVGEALLSDLLPDTFGAALDAARKTIDLGEETDDLRFDTTNKPGGKVLVVSSAPLRSQAQPGAGAVLVIRDVTRLTHLERHIEGNIHYKNIVGKSAEMEAIFQLIEDLSETDSTTLVCGESGTGKELVAAALHRTGTRSSGPFVKVNCAALPEDILESELFGHAKGAFTGAVRDRTGRFEAANGGTILLDEIGDVSPRLQLRLLRVLQEKEFERVGESRTIACDVRVIAITNQNLVEKIERGEFRQDLYYRLNVVRIDIPPLRERREDIEILIAHFCRQFNSLFKREIAGLSSEALAILTRYDWPGNAREVENCIERAFVVCRGSQILPDHLPPEIRDHQATASVASVLPESEGDGHSRDHILDALNASDWNVAKSARRLGMARNTLYQKMKSHGLERPAAH